MLIDVNTLKSVASLDSFCESGRDAFIPLTAVHLVFRRDDFSAYATDRYTLIRANYVLDVDAEFEGKTIVLMPATRKFITGVKLAKYSKQAFILDLVDDVLTLSFDGASVSQPATLSGSYPDLDKFVNEWEPAESVETLAINPNNFAKLGKVVDAQGDKVDSWEIQFGKRVHVSKPAPIRAASGAMEALIQPKVK